MTPVLRAESLSFRIGAAVLIADASLDLVPGRISILVGPNGAGKSTLLRLVTGEHRASGGRVTLGGRPLADWPPWRLACARAVLPQSTSLSLPFSAREVAGLGLEGIGRAMPVAERGSVVEAALATADVARLAGRPFHTLSGGEQQRVHFARVLCQLEAGRTIEPRQVLFLDEPIANLDLSHQIALLDATAVLAARGTAVLAIVHDLNLASAYADDLMVLDRGRIVARGTPAEVMTDALMAGVFRVTMRVGVVPSGATPFVLPKRKATIPHIQ